MFDNCLESALTLCFKSLFIWLKLRIPSHLCDLRLSVSNGCGRLGFRAFMFFKEPLLNGTRAQSHIRSHLYTEVSTSSSQTKLTLP